MRKQIIENGLIFSCILAITFIYLNPVFFNLDRLSGEDWDQHIFYHEVSQISILTYNQFPFWNPYYCGGASHIGNPQSRFLSPSLFFTLLWGTVVGMRIEIITHFIIGIIGMLLIARHFRLKFPVSFIPAILFSLNSVYIMHVAAGHSWIFSLGYLPLAFFFYLKSQLNIKYGFACAFILALMIYEGGIYIAPISMTFLLVYSLFLSLQQREILPLRNFLIIFIFCILFSAPKLFPSLELLQLYPRPTIQEKWDFMPVEDLVKAFIDPNQHYYQKPRGWWEKSAYVGIFPIVIFAVGIIKLRNLWPLYLTGIFFFLLGMGSFSEFAPWQLLKLFPVFKYMHVSTRCFIFFLFVLSIISGIFIDELIKNMKKESKPFQKLFPWAIVMYFLIDLASVNAHIYTNTFLKNDFPRQLMNSMRTHRVTSGLNDFEQIGRSQSYGARSAMLFPLLANKGTVDCYESIPVRRAAIWKGHASYKGEHYLLGKSGTADLKFWSPNKIVFDLDMGSNDTLVVNQNFDPNWKSSRGSPEPYDNLLSIKVSPGQNHVTLYYLPKSFLVGMAVAILSSLFCIIYFRRKYLNRTLG